MQSLVWCGNIRKYISIRYRKHWKEIRSMFLKWISHPHKDIRKSIADSRQLWWNGGGGPRGQLCWKIRTKICRIVKLNYTTPFRSTHVCGMWDVRFGPDTNNCEQSKTTKDPSLYSERRISGSKASYHIRPWIDLVLDLCTNKGK